MVSCDQTVRRSRQHRVLNAVAWQVRGRRRPGYNGLALLQGLEPVTFGIFCCTAQMVPQAAPIATEVEVQAAPYCKSLRGCLRACVFSLSIGEFRVQCR